NQCDLAWLGVQRAQLSGDVQRALLRYEQQLAIRVVEEALLHRAIAGVHMDADPGLHRRVAVAGHGDEAIDEIGGRLRNRQWIPAQLLWRRRSFVEWRTAQPWRFDRTKPSMDCGGTQAIQPRAAIRMARRSERRTGELLGIEPIGDLL